MNLHLNYIELNYNKYTDFELLDLFKDGDRLAYEEIYLRYWSLLFRHGRKMLRNDDEAKDLVQDVFSVLWMNGKDLVLKTNFSAYLYSVLRYKIFDLIDKNKVRTDYLNSLENFIEENSYSSDYLVREKQMEALIEQEINALPEKMRKVFELSRKSNMPYKEIAKTLDITNNTVKKQINNALRILRTKLGVIIFTLFF